MASDLFFGFPGYMGWKPDEADDRDYTYSPKFRVPWGSEEYLREKSTREGSWDEVYDQYQTGSCVANAIAAALAFECNNTKGAEAGSDLAFSPSRAFIYYNARKGYGVDADGDDEELVPDEGSFIRLGMRTLQKFGACDDVSWPLRKETIKWYPGPYAYYEAQRKMLRQYQYKRLDVKRGQSDRSKILKANDVDTMNKDGDTVLNNLRSCISQGHPVIFGFRIFYEVDKNGNNVIPWRKSGDTWMLPSVPEDRRHIGPKKDTDGHAVLAIGFLDHKKKDRSGWVKCQNSWGTDPKQGGAPFFWMPYDWITDFTATMDFWMMDLTGFPSKL